MANLNWHSTSNHNTYTAPEAVYLNITIQIKTWTLTLQGRNDLCLPPSPPPPPPALVLLDSTNLPFMCDKLTPVSRSVAIGASKWCHSLPCTQVGHILHRLHLWNKRYRTCVCRPCCVHYGMSVCVCVCHMYVDILLNTTLSIQYCRCMA